MSSLPQPHSTFLLITIVYTAIRLRYMLLNASNTKVVNKAGILDNVVLFFFGLSQIAFPVVYIFTPWLAFADYAMPDAVSLFGVIPMMIGLWLFWRSHADLGASWSVTLELNEDHKLVTNGVYRSVRHPMYSAFFLLAIGQAILLANLFAGFASLVTFSILYAIRMPREEKMMIDQFGEEYLRYSERTGRIFPPLPVFYGRVENKSESI